MVLGLFQLLFAEVSAIDSLLYCKSNLLLYDTWNLAPATCSPLFNSPLCNDGKKISGANPCDSFCQSLGCDLQLLANGMCDPQCRNDICGYDQGDCYQCAPGCSFEMLSNDVCDPACANTLCENDLGHCKACTSKGAITACYEHQINNGKCDTQCLIADCQYDGDDCLNGCAKEKIGNGKCDTECFLMPLEQDDCIPQCAPGCVFSKQYNSRCDIECALPNCAMDNGYCTGTECAPGCWPKMIGNGRCDAECFNKDCRWDNSDCVSTKQGVCAPGCTISMSQDIHCDEACRNEFCNFDGFGCSDNNNFECAPGCTYTMMNLNDVCDEPCNVPECLWDLGNCVRTMQQFDCAPDCSNKMMTNAKCDPECNIFTCAMDASRCICQNPCGPEGLTPKCSYGLSISGSCFSDLQIRVAMYNQIIRGNYDIVLDLATYLGPNSCTASDLLLASLIKQCVPKCNTAGGLYSMGMCASALPANCAVGWGPEEGQCFECNQSKVQYLGFCLDSCPAGTGVIYTISRVCSNSTVFPRSTEGSPEQLFVREDRRSVINNAQIYHHFTDALAGVWEAYTIIWLIGGTATYDVNMKFSGLSANYLLGKPDWFSTSRCLNLIVQSRPCSLDAIPGCIEGRTTLMLHNPASFAFAKKQLTFKNVVLTSRSRFESSQTMFCPHFHQRGDAVLDDRGEVQERVSPLLHQCSQFANFSLFVLQERARLFLEVILTQNVRFEDLTLQFKSVIMLEGGNVTMTNVDFANIHLNGGAVILQSQECLTLSKSCGCILYNEGTVSYLNNEFEVQSDIAYGSFLRALNFYFLRITSITFNYNIASAALISVQDFKTIQISNCTFSANVALGGVLSIEFSRKLNPGTENLYVANLSFFSTFSRSPLVQISFALSARPVVIANCTFHDNTNAAIVVAYQGVFNSTSTSSVSFQGLSFSKNRAFSALVQVHNYPKVVFTLCVFSENGDGFSDLSVLHFYLDAPGTYAKLEVASNETRCNNIISLQGCLDSLLIDSVISDNVCKDGSTGVAYVAAGSRHKITNTVFTRNAGTAALIVGERVALEIRNFTALGNRLQVVTASANSRLEILDSVFQENQAKTGSITARSALNITVLRCRFLSNEAQASNGGAIGLIVDEALEMAVLQVQDSTFQGNSAEIGGAIIVSSTIANIMQLTLVNCGFASNRATVRGSSLSVSGAITLSEASRIDTCTFTNESSPRGAVNLAFWYGTLSLLRSVFSRNLAVLMIDVDAFISVQLQDVNFLDNLAPAIVNYGLLKKSILRTNICHFQGNLAAIDLQYAVWIDSGSTISESVSTAIILAASQADLLGTKFKRNHSPSLGGAVNVGSAAVLNCTVCEFVDNSAAWNGGTIYAAPLSTVHLATCSFLRNTANNLGAAIFAETATISITSCSFEHNAAGHSATIAGVSSILHLTFCKFNENNALLTSGLSFALTSVLTLTSCDFHNQNGQEAAFLSLRVLSMATAVNSTFNTGSGMASAYVTSSTFVLIDCRFIDIVGKDSVFFSFQSVLQLKRVQIINMGASGRIASIQSGKFEAVDFVVSDYRLDGLLAERAAVVVSSSSFSGGNTAVRCVQCSSLTIANSLFSHSHLGAVVVQSSGLVNSEISVSNSVFIWNSAERGGAIYADSVSLNVSDTEFLGNSAHSGGALFLACTYSAMCKFSIAKTVFSNNTVKVAGGAIAWDSAAPAIAEATFYSNTAKYGPDISSFLSSASAEFHDNSHSIYNIPPGGRIPVSLIVRLYDHYGQLLVLDNTTECEVQPLNESSATVTGTKRLIVQQGIANFTDLVIYAEPKTVVVLHVEAAGIVNSSTVELRMRECVPGESTSGRRCVLCGNNSFGLDPSKPCESCPANSLCLGNTTVLPNPGYWRSGPSSRGADRCRNPSACLGGMVSGKVNFNGFCDSSFEGYMCLACIDGHYSQGNFECIKCTWAAVQGACVVSAATLVVVILVRETARKRIGLPYLKILVSYLQTLYFVTQLNAEWPRVVADLWEGMRRLGAPLDTSMPLDCWLSFYHKTVVYSTLPFTIALTATLLWFACILVRRSLAHVQYLYETIVAAYFIIYPTVARAAFSLFSCTHNSLTFDAREQCWSSVHYKFMLGSGVPSLLLCVFAAPFASRTTVSMTQGFQSNFKDWEAVSMFRKAIMAAICMLFTSSFRAQALALQLVIFVSLISHYMFWPFANTRLNRLEFVSLLAVSIVQLCTVVTITKGSSAAWAGPLVASACLYPCYWAWEYRSRREVYLHDFISIMRPAKFRFESMKNVYLHYLHILPDFTTVPILTKSESKVQPAALHSK